MSNLERIMIFIDHNNIFHEYSKMKISFDYIKLVNLIKDKFNLVKINFYIGIDPTLFSPKRNRQERFLYFLKKQGFIIKRIPLKILPDGRKQEKGIDVLLSIDILKYGYENKYDIGALVSGDGDYEPLLKVLLSMNKKVHICSFRKPLSYRIKKIIDPKDIIYIDNYLSHLIRSKKIF